MPSSYIVSIVSLKEEYMIGMVCIDHRDRLEERIRVMQSEGSVPMGTIKIHPAKIISTDCVKGTDEDRMEISSKRGITMRENDI
jgi:hypothetical protein